MGAATTENVTPIRAGLGGNEKGELFIRIPQTAKAAMNDKLKVLGVTGILDTWLYEVGAPTLRETTTISATSNEITLTSANTGHVRGFVWAKL